MKRIFLTIVVLLFVVSTVEAKERTKVYDGVVRISADSMALHQGRVFIGMNIGVDGLGIPDTRSLILTPVIRGEGESIELPEIIINGRNLNKVYKRGRCMRIKSNAGKYAGPYEVMEADRKEETDVPYNVVIPYEEWMDGAVLELREEVYCCGGHRQQISVFPVVVPVKVTPLVKKESMEEEISVIVEQKQTTFSKQGTAYIDFRENKWDVMPGFRTNNSELNGLHDMIMSVINDPDAEITSITITGYASPEGSYERNMKLSKNRAESFMGYLVERYRLDPTLFYVDWRGENWDGLKELVESSSMDHKTEILDIMSHTEIAEGREKKLMEFKGGVPYRYMLLNMFPKLRKVVYTLYYTVTKN